MNRKPRLAFLKQNCREGAKLQNRFWEVEEAGFLGGFAAIKCAAIVVVRVLSGVSQNIGCVSARQKQKPRLGDVQP